MADFHANFLDTNRISQVELF